MQSPPPLTYKSAGVDIDEGERLIGLIAPAARATARPGASAALGGFAALLDLKAAGFVDPIVLATTDGVGTKLKIAIETGLHEGIGIDLVAMCVNDLLAQGAEPLLFLDYYATGRLSAESAAAVITGIAHGCSQAGCALAGGETAEMPGMYQEGDYDLAGFALGAAERGEVLPKLARMAAGDVLIGLCASGPHSNGYALIRKIIARTALPWDAPAPFSPGQSLAQALLTPTRIYARSMLPLLRQGAILGAAHITGGGLSSNTARALPKGLLPALDWQSWPMPAVFQYLIDAGAVPVEDARRTFNLGIGMTLIVAAGEADGVLNALRAAGETAWIIGEARPL